MNQLTTPASSSSEADSLASEMASSYRRMIEFYRDDCDLSLAEAVAKVDGELDPAYEQRLMSCKPDELSWLDMHNLANRDPQLAAERWDQIKHAARNELRSGHRAAKATESTSLGPWDRARFMAIREELATEWQPRNGVERTLIDTMAQAQTSFLFWQERLTAWSALEPGCDSKTVKEQGVWYTPRVTESAAIDQAATMVDRFNRLFIRTLRALRDLRRYSTNILVQNAGQVNVVDARQL